MRFRLGSAMVVALATVTLGGFGAAPARAADRLPDLAVAPLDNISFDTTTIPGHRLMRYRTKLVNTGAGPFELRGSRPDTTSPTMTVTQRIYDTAGGSRDVPTAALMQYEVGDGHQHWHTIDLMTGE